MRIITLYFFILSFFVYAKEPIVAILDNIPSNAYQEFHIKNYAFSCSTYGVVPIEKLYLNATLNSTCQKKISDFYKTDPNSKYFAQRVLKVQQQYHLEFKEGECTLYALGQKTFSELLLENGLAIIKPLFRDDEFKYLFNQAQKRAKANKKGMWKDNVIKSCIAELYK